METIKNWTLFFLQTIMRVTLQSLKFLFTKVETYIQRFF